MAYHVRVLVEGEILPEVEQIQRRGAMKRRYSLGGEWSRVTVVVMGL